MPRAIRPRSTRPRQLHVAGMNLQNLLATAHVGEIHPHFAIEAPRAQQRGVEHVLAVGGRDNDHAFRRLDAVHLHQQRIQRLLALVVTAPHSGAATAAHRIDFVDENKAGRVLLALLKHVAHARSAHANEHLHEIRAADAKERHVGFARNGLGQQRLSRAGRPDHEHTLGDAPAQLLEPARIAQEFHDLAQLFLCLVDCRRHP